MNKLVIYVWRKLVSPYFKIKAKFKSNKNESKKRDQVLVTQGRIEFEKTNQTPDSAYQALIRLYCATNGAFNDELQSQITRESPAHNGRTEEKGVIGKLDQVRQIDINRELKQNGYFFFEERLPVSTCEKLYVFALNTPCSLPGRSDKVIYNPISPVSEIYRLNISDLINNEVIQELIMDPALIQIARNYLESEPIFDFPAMWWSTAYLKEASSEAAQLYHFDMDRIKWLKMFFYISDVNPENGPHCYIQGSHRTGAKPPELLKRGYVRIDDKELLSHYPEEDFKNIVGKAGSMFAGDTKCWHKGTALKKGHRLVLELEYTSSLFGANYPKMVVKNSSPGFRSFCKENEVYASNLFFS